MTQPRECDSTLTSSPPLSPDRYWTSYLKRNITMPHPTNYFSKSSTDAGTRIRSACAGTHWCLRAHIGALSTGVLSVVYCELRHNTGQMAVEL